MQAACKGNSVVNTDAVGLLSQQYFFTSTKLAMLGTEAEILTQVHHPHLTAFCNAHVLMVHPESAFCPQRYHIFILRCTNQHNCKPVNP